MKKKFKTEEKFVAFVDILGFKNIVNNDKEPERILKAIEDSKKVIEDYYKEVKQEHLCSKFKDDLKITWFSDSLILSTNGEYMCNLFSLINFLDFIQNTLLSEGILIRGAIALGECYHTNSNVFGKAMIEAYELESNKAIVPRIILSKSLIEDVLKRLSKDGDQICGLIINHLMLDKDDIYYIDYLGILFLSEDEDMITSVKNLISDGLENPMKVHLKYLWLKEYYNDTIRTLDRSLRKKFILN